MAKVRVAAIQMDVRHGDVEANLRHALEMLEKSATQGAEIAVLPEMWLTGYAFRDLKEFAVKAVPPALERLQELARQQRQTIVAGSFPELADERVYNTAYTIGPDGKLLEKYRKIHLFSYTGEERYIAGGDRLPPLLESAGVNMGVTICYDIRFPEIYRPLAVRGAQIIFVPAQLPMPRVNHWRVLLQARAIENQTFVVGCNRVGVIKHLEYFGHSMIVDPWGDILAEAEAEETILMAELNLAAVAETREKMTVFQDRTPTIYQTFKD